MLAPKSAPFTGFPAAPCLPPLDFNLNQIQDKELLPTAQKLIQGKRLDRQDGLTLMTSTDIYGLGAMAHAARLAKNQDKTFYILNRHLNYTNICANHCRFCAFWRNEKSQDAVLLTPAKAAAKAAETPQGQVDEFHIVGGCHPSLTLEYYLELFQALAKVHPNAALKAFTAVEIDNIARVSGITAEEVLDALILAGLGALTGGGAEVFSPRVRERLCPNKASGQRWLEVSALAHKRGIPTNATLLYGHIETHEERVDHLLALRDQQDKSGGFNAFIPLSFHPTNTFLSDLDPTTGLDDLRVIAVSRLLLDNFPHIKSYWVMLGRKLAQLALLFGADDLEGTVVEEHITHDAGATTAQGLTEPQLLKMIQSAGLKPVRRDSYYRPIYD